MVPSHKYAEISFQSSRVCDFDSRRAVPLRISHTVQIHAIAPHPYLVCKEPVPGQDDCAVK